MLKNTRFVAHFSANARKYFKWSTSKQLICQMSRLSREITDHCQIKLMSQSRAEILICVTKGRTFFRSRAMKFSVRIKQSIYMCFRLSYSSLLLLLPAPLCTVRKPQNIHLMSFISIVRVISPLFVHLPIETNEIIFFLSPFEIKIW